MTQLENNLVMYETGPVSGFTINISSRSTRTSWSGPKGLEVGFRGYWGLGFRVWVLGFFRAFAEIKDLGGLGCYVRDWAQ